MNKDLKDEYERYTKETAPDLWNRIEEGLTEKPQEVYHPKAEAKRENGFRKKYIKFVPVAAAAVLLLITVPVVYGIGLTGNKSMQDSMEMEMIKAESQTTESEEAPSDLCEGKQENGMADMNDSIYEEDASDRERIENFPFPEKNKTIYLNDRLVSAEIKIEKQDKTIYHADGTEQVTCYFELPVLQEDTKAARKINGDLRGLLEETMKERQEWEACFGEGEEFSGFYITDAFLTYNEGGIISIGFHEEVWAGGVVDRVTYSRVYDLNTGERLNLADVLGVEDGELHKTLLENFQKSAGEQPDNALWERYTPKELSEKLKDYEADDFHFCISAEGEVEIWFAKYEIGLGADAEQSAAIGKVKYGQN